MNNQDKKKETELKCLNTAIRNCLSQKGDSRVTDKLMSGTNVERNSDGRPDCIHYIALTNKNEMCLRGCWGSLNKKGITVSENMIIASPIMEKLFL